MKHRAAVLRQVRAWGMALHRLIVRSGALIDAGMA